ncbi:MAG: hypothetical protein ABR962_09890 [Candidatus Bathyarchaeia archaeon]
MKISPEQKWIILNIVVPFSPFIVGALFRFLITLQFAWDYTFEGNEILISLTLLSFFIAQSLHSCKRPRLDNKDKQQERKNETTAYYVLGSIFMALFVAAVFFVTENSKVSFSMNHYETQVLITQGIAIVAAPVMAVCASITQRNYHLESSMS